MDTIVARVAARAIQSSEHELVLRVAHRHIQASLFNVGDIILFGKYKNSKGRITGFGKDPKGNPTVDIEPIPKGRKQTKTFGLFKIWKAQGDTVEKAERAEREEKKTDKKATSKFAYHGTREATLPNLKKRGLIPGAYSSYSDAYSEYDDGNHLFFSDDPEYLRGNYGDTIVRFPWPSDTKPDVNKYGRTLGHQFVTKKKIGPDEIDVEIGGVWVPLESFEGNKKAASVKVVIDRDETLKARQRFPGFNEGIVGTFESAINLYRIFDGEEVARIVRTGRITGGTYSVKAERAYGASWGANITEVIQWGMGQRGKRLGEDLFLAKLDGFDRKFYHLGPKVDFDPEGAEQQEARVDSGICNTGNACTMIDVSANDVDFYTVSSSGQIEKLTLSELKEYVTKKPVKPIDLRSIHPGLFQGSILGVDVRVVEEHSKSEKSLFSVTTTVSWSVYGNDDRPLVLGADTKEAAIELAQRSISKNPDAPALIDVSDKKPEPPEKLRSPEFALQPKDKFVVSKGSRDLGIAMRNSGRVVDVWQNKGDARVNVTLSFTWPLKFPDGRWTRDPVTLYAMHPNRLADPDIALLNSRGSRVLIRKK